VARDESDGDVWIRDATARVGPQLQHIRRRDEIEISDITVSLVKKKKGEDRERERKTEKERKRENDSWWPNRGTRNLFTIRRISIEYKWRNFVSGAGIHHATRRDKRELHGRSQMQPEIIRHS